MNSAGSGITTCSSAALHLSTGRSDMVIRQYVENYSCLRFSSGGNKSGSSSLLLSPASSHWHVAVFSCTICCGYSCCHSSSSLSSPLPMLESLCDDGSSSCCDSIDSGESKKQQGQ